MHKMFDLTEKVCLVTGASRGIGLALIKAFLKRGANCLMVDVDYKVNIGSNHLLYQKKL